MLNVPSFCTGCAACMNICPSESITLKAHKDGFLYPEIDKNNCINCNQCEKICPLVEMPNINVNTVALALKNVNIAERMSSTSGGVFPLIAGYVLNKNGIVYGAAYDSGFKVHHIAVTQKSDLYLLQGAKYSQSIIGQCFSDIRDYLLAGRIVLFSGTPCQCMGLHSFLGTEYANLVMVDIICHGVPSPKVWQAYIDYRSQKENSGKRPLKINMRSKSSGWSRYGYSTMFQYDWGNISQIPNDQDLFMKAFIGNICLRHSCSECQAKGVDRCTDITLGDYWGIWNQHPEFDDNKGTSVVFIHSKKAEKMLIELKDKFECLKVDIEAAYRENVSLVMSSKSHEKRKEFLEQIISDNFEELVLKYFPSVEIKRSGIVRKIKGKIKRSLLKQ